MNLGKHSRIQVYNARLMIRNARELLEEVEGACSNEEDMKAISHYVLRLEAIDSGLSTVLKLSKENEPVLPSDPT